MRQAIARGREWVEGLQSRDGGWGAFDADNTHYYLNNIPFADHGALLDPPTADVTARCVAMLAQLGETRSTSRALARGDRLRSSREQETDGSWFGRWGINYIYGTWSALCALNAAGLDPRSAPMRRAADWLIAIQNPDGGWGEDVRQLQARLQRLRGRAVHGFADRLGAARPDGGGRGGPSGGGARHRLSAARRANDGFWSEPFTPRRLPARVLSALSRLFEVLPAVGAGPLPQPEARQQPRRRLSGCSDPRIGPAAWSGKRADAPPHFRHMR